jgi:hypothetical protein
MIQNWSKALYTYSSGEWVIILSDDDLIIDDEYLHKAQSLIENNDDIVIVHANRIVKTDNKEYLVRRILPKICDGKWMFNNYLLNEDIMFTFVTGIFNKKIALKVDAFKAYGVVGSDTMEFLKMSLYGNIGFIEEFVAVYRIHDNNPYFRFGVDYLLTTNIETFNAPFRLAKSMQLFDDSLLIKWRIRLIKQYISSNLREILIKNAQTNLLIDFILKSIKNYPFCWPIIFRPFTLFRIMIYFINKWK